MTIDRVPGAAASNVALTQSEARPTPTPVRPSVSFGAVLSSTTKPLSAVVNSLPGSSLIAAAVRNGPQVTLSEGGASAGTLGGVSSGGGLAAGPGTGGVGTGGSVSTGDVAGATGDMMAQQQQLMMEQMAISSATETFNTQSNIEAAAHQARMNAISNMRG